MRVLVDILDTAGVLLVCVLILGSAIVLRRGLLQNRGATLQCGMRVGIATSARRWHTGLARYTAEDLQWYRLLSFSYQPKRTLVRRSIEIVGRRYPRGAEMLVVPHGAVVVTCNVVTRKGESMDVELAMSEAAFTGFLAWIESSAPGAHTHPDTRVT
jgi:hypothetical protein